MPPRQRHNTMALAVAGVVVLSVLSASTGLSHGARSLTWIALAAAGVALVSVAVQTFAPAYLLGASALTLIAAGTATSTEGDAIARGLSILMPPCVVALAALAVTPRARAAIVAVVGAFVAGPVRSLFFDPFRDANCAGCRHSAFAISPDNDVASVLAVVGAVLLVAGLTVLVIVSTHRVPAAALAVVGLLAIPGLPLGPVPAAGAAVLIATLSGIVVCVRRLRRRSRLGLLERAPRTPDALLDGLRRAFRDPTLTVQFSADGASWVDASAAPASPTSADRRYTPIARLVRLEHDPATDVAAVLDEGIPAQLIVSLEEQRLSTGLAEQLRLLSESRARVVRRADDERRRLERDLHDGAQQHVLALGFDLRTALAATPDPQTQKALEECIAITRGALDEMREVAHGMYPPLLALSGLGPALTAMPNVTSPQLALTRRAPTSVERLAYLVVEDLANKPDHRVQVGGSCDAHRLVLDISGGGATPAPLIRERVGALGGSLEQRAGVWRLEVPCA